MILNIILGVLGIVLYTLIKARPYLQSSEIPTNWNKLLWENLPSWLWAILVLIVIAVILTYAPEANQVVGQLFGGMDLQNSPVGFLMMGIALSFGTKEIQK
ncbi:hypothetical protein FAZ19_16315 [Sphingobacterium alkalisoli]|uniref:Uncharacterized protein n=1 Tax=Sphingobacterium alkalisoli TaxID=1874115 RepID=A0A4U0GXC1_9SPHI|nr:hypothetical protein [Sphingobacterium alkalisoli]TJY63831.1 hypothetical protein FAZ19_16315 [Sphingobacterium alkalisoli]GGH24598.1 hypothetical protein GCM10011418_32630 [Sphingobacterium alkalisoli]